MMETKTLYRIYEGTEFPTTTVDEICVKTSNGDYVEAMTGVFHSGATHSEVRKFVGQVTQIVDPALLGVNSNYQNAKIPFIDCLMTMEEFELYDGTNKIYYCAEVDANFHEFEFDKLIEVFEDAQQI